MAKRCTKCGEMKPLDCFYRNGDKLRADCIPCNKALVKACNERNREKRLAYKKAYREANREKIAAHWARYYAENREKIAESRKRHYSPEAKKRARKRELQRQDRERRRARLLDAFVEDVVLDDILLRDLGRCGICGGPIMEALELDHIVPLVAGGTHEPKNVQLAHLTCNRRKGTKTDY